MRYGWCYRYGSAGHVATCKYCRRIPHSDCAVLAYGSKQITIRAECDRFHSGQFFFADQFFSKMFCPYFLLKIGIYIWIDSFRVLGRLVSDQIYQTVIVHLLLSRE